ncbi:hypothetical protein BCR32DRAFT_249826 [Anaeromyces robustus]|uniref:NlpC/P60 domain-containing protein n=1 Tax=Anaeromyces robustus TaxID=1754192 RepID=A0A1Y1WNM5_9FUNG|nr:hypothetical protein BCR32DRAFT_249826 [Anaeromyces robustus]|eukprot:ORX75082.1 hypothetical protein BCR32DRAFT_249826 [Anaeromyces robustus]
MYPCGSTANQYQHLINHSDKWKYMGYYRELLNNSNLEVGDILIVGKKGNVSGHTVLYVGNELIRRKYPEQTNSYFVSSSIKSEKKPSRSPGCGDTTGSYVKDRNYEVFRYIGSYDGNRKNYSP